MYIADMHADSLLTVNSDKGLVSEYNTSKKYPYLQFFAAFTPRRSRTMEMRRKDVMKYLNIYAYECERLSLIKIEDVRSLSEVSFSEFIVWSTNEKERYESVSASTKRYYEIDNERNDE
jgi:hypothetical protein